MPDGTIWGRAGIRKRAAAAEEPNRLGKFLVFKLLVIDFSVWGAIVIPDEMEIA